jgi:hypothetical protein
VKALQKNHLATKTQEKKRQSTVFQRSATTKAEKPPSHESTTEKNAGAHSSNPVHPPKQKKPPTIKKMIEPINKRKLAWERTEEGNTTIDGQLVHEFSNLSTKQ